MKGPMSLRSLYGCFGGALFLSSAIAWATPGFPAAVRRELALGYPLDCSLCHLNGVTGRGTVTTPFGIAVTDSRSLSAIQTLA